MNVYNLPLAPWDDPSANAWLDDLLETRHKNNMIKYSEKTSIEKLEEEYPIIAEGYKNICKEQYELFARKMLSYGMSNISMGTSLETSEDKKLSLTSVWVRCHDKMSRLKNLVMMGKENYVKDESINDTYMDLVNYNIIAQLVNKDLWKK